MLILLVLSLYAYRASSYGGLLTRRLLHALVELGLHLLGCLIAVAVVRAVVLKE